MLDTHLNPSVADPLIKKDTSILLTDGARHSNVSALHRASSRYSGKFSNNANNQSQMIDKIMLSQYINMRKETMEKLKAAPFDVKPRPPNSKTLAGAEDGNEEVRRSTI